MDTRRYGSVQPRTLAPHTLGAPYAELSLTPVACLCAQALAAASDAHAMVSVLEDRIKQLESTGTDHSTSMTDTRVELELCKSALATEKENTAFVRFLTNVQTTFPRVRCTFRLRFLTLRERLNYVSSRYVCV